MMLAAQLQIGFATAVDGDVTRIIDNLAVVKPTFMAAAPRIFEKVYSRVTTGAAESKAKKAIFDWALGVGHQLVRAQQDGRTPGRMLAAQQQIADRLVFSKLRARFGGRLRYFISGSAALSKDIGGFFMAAGVPVLEGYGLTETSAAAFVNRPERNKLGTVGLPLPGTQVRIADDGEILVKGPRRHARLPQPAGADRGDAHRRRLAAHGRHRRARR
jgi:long-chain acyl-CoA synthetase